MNLYDRLGGQSMAPANMLQQAIETAKANYKNILQQKGLTIPDGMTDPQQMSQHLVQSGQIQRLVQSGQLPRAQYQQAMQMMQRMR